jgi:peptide/nickel transport system permease protein
MVLGMLLAAMVLSGLLLPLDLSGFDLSRAWDGPSPDHPCGRDGLGRDLLARLLVGTGTSLGIAMASLGIALVLGAGLGGLAGWCGGWVDAVVMRGVDLLMGVRELALAIVVAVVIGPGSTAIILILGLGCAPPLIRFVRSLALVQSGQAHVLAATALGASPYRVFITHILPNIMGPVVVRSAAIVGPLVQAEAALSFLGIGVQDPAPSLGTLVRDGLSGLRSGPHLIVATTAVVFLVALTFTLLADELRDAGDPRWKKRGLEKGGAFPP